MRGQADVAASQGEALVPQRVLSAILCISTEPNTFDKLLSIEYNRWQNTKHVIRYNPNLANTFMLF